jgi:catechol 2,3-dioxygenase-like lactoylglutathione lyase family enzyme
MRVCRPVGRLLEWLGRPGDVVVDSGPRDRFDRHALVTPLRDAVAALRRRQPRPAKRSGGHGERTSAMMRGDMAIQRMDNVLIVVEDLEAAIALFVELGMELEAKTQVEGDWVGRVIGLGDVRADIAMLRTPDGHGRVELTRFHRPAAVSAQPERAPANTLGIRRIMFAVDDIDDVVSRLRGHGAELVGEIAQYEDAYRLCFVRAREGFILGLAEQLG